MLDRSATRSKLAGMHHALLMCVQKRRAHDSVAAEWRRAVSSRPPDPTTTPFLGDHGDFFGRRQPPAPRPDSPRRQQERRFTLPGCHGACVGTGDPAQHPADSGCAHVSGDHRVAGGGGRLGWCQRCNHRRFVSAHEFCGSRARRTDPCVALAGRAAACAVWPRRAPASRRRRDRAAEDGHPLSRVRGVGCRGDLERWIHHLR